LLQILLLAESGIAALDSDPTAELSHFHIRLSSLAIVLLHDDILTLCVESDGSSLARSSVQQMKTISKDFFDELGLFAVTGYGNKDFHTAKETFLRACQLNHIRHVFSVAFTVLWVTVVAQWLRNCATNRKVAGSIAAGVSGFFIDIKSFPSHYGPRVDSASNRNEYQEYFLAVKVASA